MCEWIKIKGITQEQIDKCECPDCKSKLKSRPIQRQFRAVAGGFPFDMRVEGYVCSQCHEAFYPEKTIKEMAKTMNKYVKETIIPTADNIQSYTHRDLSAVKSYY